MKPLALGVEVLDLERDEVVLFIGVVLRVVADATVGCIEVEIFSRDRWWQQPPEIMTRAILERMNNAF